MRSAIQMMLWPPFLPRLQTLTSSTSLWPSTVGWPDLTVLSWPRAFWHRNARHGASGYGRQGIYRWFIGAA